MKHNAYEIMKEMWSIDEEIQKLTSDLKKTEQITQRELLERRIDSVDGFVGFLLALPSNAVFRFEFLHFLQQLRRFRRAPEHPELICRHKQQVDSLLVPGVEPGVKVCRVAVPDTLCQSHSLIPLMYLSK